MAGEQQIVVRDFMGLGDTVTSTEREFSRLVDANKENHLIKHFLGTITGLETTPPRLFHDSDSTTLCRPRTAIDQPIQNMMATFPKSELHKLHPAHDDIAGRITGPVAATLNGNNVPSGVTFKGMKQCGWNRTVTVQQCAPLKQEERTFDKDCSERLVSHLQHSSHIQDLVNGNGINPLCSQSLTLGHNPLGVGGDSGNMQFRNFGTYGTPEAVSHFAAQARRYGDLPMGIFAQPFEEHNSSAYIASNFEGTVPKSTLSLSLPNLKEQSPFTSSLRAQPITVTCGTSSLARPVGQSPVPGSYLTFPVVGGVPAGNQTRMFSSSLTGKQTSAQLTIFYDGNVNVYDNIPVEKAQAIMHFAGNGSSWQTEVQNLSAEQCVPMKLFNAATCQSRPGSPQRAHNLTINLQEKLQQSLQTGQPVVNTMSAAGNVNQNTPPASKQPECSKPNAPSSAASALPAGQPVAPRALPQARKASLTRFLEKRRERVLSKAPYLMKKSLPEQSFLPGERFSSSNYDDTCPTAQDDYIDEKAGSMTCGMEEMTGSFEYASTCDMAAKEESRLGTAESRIAVEGEVAVHDIL